MSIFSAVATEKSWLARRYDKSLTPEAYTEVAKASTTNLQSLSDFTICSHFRIPNDTTNFRTIFASYAAFNRRAYLLVSGAGGDEGKLEGHFRTQSGTSSILSTASDWDDDEWHQVGYTRKSSSNLFTLYADSGTALGTDTTDPGTDSVSCDVAVGNHHIDSAPTGLETDGKLYRTFLVDAEMTYAQITALLNDGTVPGGMTVLYEDSDGVDNASVVVEIGP